MSYTDEEVQAAVEKLVRTSIRRTQGALGNREVGVTFNDYQDAAAGVFILFQNAPFYLVYLAGQNLKVLLESQREYISELTDVVRATQNRTTAIKNLSPLANARVALDGLLLASSSRTTTFNELDAVPAYQRFDQNTQQFLDESSRNIRKNGELVRTPEEARALLAGYYSTLKTAYEDIIRRVGLLAGAIADFTSMNLPARMISSILENARDSLRDWYTQLQEMKEKDRLKLIRDVTLDVLAARSTISGFGSLSGPTFFVPLEGTGGVFADATHEATSAEVSSTLLGPYSILDDASLIHFEVEGDSTIIEVQGSFVAAIEATVYAPFPIGKPNVVGPGGVDNDELRIQLLNRVSWGGVESFDVDFPDVTGVTYEAWEAAGIINFAIPTSPTNYPLICEPYCNPLKFGGGVNIFWDSGNSWYLFTSINTSTDFGALGIVEAAYILVPDTTSVSQNAVFRVQVGGVGTTTLRCDLVFHPDGLSGSALDELAKDIRITDTKLPIRLRITRIGDKAPRYNVGWVHEAKPDAREAALDNKWGIAVPMVGVSGDEDLQFNAATYLGFYPGMEVLSRRTPASVIATNVEDSPAAALTKEARVDAETYFSATHYSGRGRTDPFSYLTVVASVFAEDSLVATDQGGNVWRFSATGAVTAGVTTAHILAIRASADTADIGLYGPVTAVTDTYIEANMGGPVAAPGDVDIELGPDLTVPTTLSHDATVIISNSPMNDGIYGVLDTGSVPFELELDKPLAFPSWKANLPVYFDLEVGYYGVTFKSTDTTLNTEISVTDGGASPESCADRFFNILPATGVGSTSYWQLPEWNKQLNEGDLLELYPTQFDSPASSTPVVGTEESSLILQLESVLPTDTPSYTFTVSGGVPFARIRNARMNNYGTFQDSLESWLELAVNQPVYFKELQRLLNPLAVNTNPSLDQVNDACTQLEGFDTALASLEGFIDLYSADVVPQIDVLLTSLQEKGADRARDLLLEGQFNTFFGMNMDEMSYSGTVQAQLKEINREDLPVRKDNRTGRRQKDDRLLASYDEKDFEFDTSDMDTSEELDIPAGTVF